MTTVSELIKKLESLPPETTVEVVRVRTDSYESYGVFEDLDLYDYSVNFNYLGSILYLGES